MSMNQLDFCPLGYNYYYGPSFNSRDFNGWGSHTIFSDNNTIVAQLVPAASSTSAIVSKRNLGIDYCRVESECKSNGYLPSSVSTSEPVHIGSIIGMNLSTMTGSGVDKTECLGGYFVAGTCNATGSSPAKSGLTIGYKIYGGAFVHLAHLDDVFPYPSNTNTVISVKSSIILQKIDSNNYRLFASVIATSNISGTFSITYNNILNFNTIGFTVSNFGMFVESTGYGSPGVYAQESVIEKIYMVSSPYSYTAPTFAGGWFTSVTGTVQSNQIVPATLSDYVIAKKSDILTKDQILCTSTVFNPANSVATQIYSRCSGSHLVVNSDAEFMIVVEGVSRSGSNSIALWFKQAEYGAILISLGDYFAGSESLTINSSISLRRTSGNSYRLIASANVIGSVSGNKQFAYDQIINITSFYVGTLSYFGVAVGSYGLTSKVTALHAESNACSLGCSGGMNINFDYTPKTGNYPLQIQFTDLSVADMSITDWLWDFGDGIYSIEQNPNHIYKYPGEFIVTLTINSAMEKQSKSVIINIKNPYLLEQFR